METRQASLTAKQERFAVLIAQGLTSSAAYRGAYDAENMKPEQVWTEASLVRSHPKVSKRIRELLHSARVSDLDDIGRAVTDLMEDLAAAREAKNWTAVAQFTRMRMQMHSLLRDQLVVSAETSLSDEQLIERLAGDDPQKLAVLQTILPADSFGDTRH